MRHQFKRHIFSGESLLANNGTSTLWTIGAVTWPGEIDLAPDAMHDEIKKNGKWVL
jgi:hypothetical protein